MPVARHDDDDADKEELKFPSNIKKDNNIPFTIRELQSIINKSEYTATGPDEIHYKFLKYQPETSLAVVL